MKSKSTAGLFICCVAVFGSSFLSWGSFEIDLDALNQKMSQIPFMDDALGDRKIFGTGTTTAEMTGWSGHAKIGAARIPNWVVGMSVVVVAILGLLGSASGKKELLAVALIPALYSMFHLGWVVTSLFRFGSVGIGAVCSLTALVLLIAFLTYALLGPRRATEPNSLT